ncbi:interleukin-12 receptor subunit beta-1-like [Engystomops pustulosus]|uniref:interleukin-12 receptor subunit beta-1-like n=1 Tax=Engystomops pustulosus TaxID=76066 RepID=UPI003AFB4DBE
MKWMKLLLENTISRTGINALCTMLLLIHVTLGEQKGLNENKKTPEDLICYQNFTLKDNFCYCSWKAGEDSHNPTYTLTYCLLRDMECEEFPAGKLTYIILNNDEVHLRQNISMTVTAEENGQNYTSKKISLIFDKAVKLDPPDHKKITIFRTGTNITVLWTRTDLFPGSLKFNTKKEVRIKENSLYLDPLLCKTSTPTTCQPAHNGIPICKEQCEFALDGHQSHYFQIRQTYKEGVWSEWSEPILVPAEIGPVQIVNVTTSRSNIAGIRTISLHFKPYTKEEGNMNYHINVSFLHCCNVTTSHLSEYNWFQANISRAAYNVTVIASNQVQYASPWSTVIEEDWAAIPFQNVTLSGNNLTIKWKGEKAGKSSYCIVWKTRETKGEIYTELVGNNNVTILTDNFLPMKCYRIDIHKISKSQITLGTTYYLKPSSSIGPRNLTVINVTVDSILLKWDAFDLYECQEILQNWVITREDHATNVSKLSYANSSVTQYLVEGLPLGFNYTFEVKGITIFGEKTRSSFKSVSSPWTVENTNKRILEKTIGIILALLLAAFLLLIFWFKVTQCICQDLPNPSNSNAATFASSDNKDICRRQHLAHSSIEEKNTELLIIETFMKNDDIDRAVKESEMEQLVKTTELIENELVMTEVDPEVEIDLQFEYRKQVTPMTPIKDKDTETHFFEQKETDLPQHSESSREDD